MLSHTTREWNSLAILVGHIIMSCQLHYGVSLSLSLSPSLLSGLYLVYSGVSTVTLIATAARLSLQQLSGRKHGNTHSVSANR